MFVRKYGILLFAAIGLGISACSDDEGQAGRSYVYVNPGSYEKTVLLGAAAGTAEGAEKRAMDQTGAFTAEYDAKSVFLHSKTDPNKVLELPLVTNDPDCANCDSNSIRFNVEVFDDQSFKVSAPDGTSVMFESEEELYFSSQATERWEGKSVDASPVSGQSVLIRDKENNQEVYRSAKTGEGYDYQLNDLLALDRDVLMMNRTCGAFRVYFLFTDLSNDIIPGDVMDYYTISEENWRQITGMDPQDWSGKLYIGPFFCDAYDLNREEAVYEGGHKHGYYATNKQKYIPLGSVAYSYTHGRTIVTYEGFGITTAYAEYLITPYDVAHGENFMFYAFLKDNVNNLDSDAGSKYITYSLTQTIPAFNTTTNIVVVFDVDQIARAFSTSAGVNKNTGGKRGYWDGLPERLDIQPAKVFYINE